MVGGHHGRIGHHAAALVDRGYLKDNATVLPLYRLLMGEIAQGTLQINGFVKPRRVQVRKYKWKTYYCYPFTFRVLFDHHTLQAYSLITLLYYMPIMNFLLFSSEIILIFYTVTYFNCEV